MAVIIGTPLADNLIALALGDELRGLGGNDSLDASSITGGGVRLLGGDGNDLLLGGAGNDQLFGGAGADTMNGGAGNDSYEVDNTNDTILDSDGRGSINAYVSYTIPVIGLSLALQTAGITGTGTSGSELIISYASNTTLRGLGGNDVLKGGSGSIVQGGDGNDVLEITSSGTGTLEGGDGSDTYNVYVLGGTLRIDDRSGGIDTIFTTIDNFSLTSMPGVTYIGGTLIENLTLAAPGASSGLIGGPITASGNSINNIIVGNRQNNILNGLGGNDTIYGSFGDDTIDGGTGNDQLFGQQGNDTLIGGIGVDTLVGGIGNDTYQADSSDIIVELNNEGTDIVFVNGSLTTSAAVEFINTTTTTAVTINLSSRTTANADGSGTTISVSNSSSAGDILIGGAGNDVLLGKAGIDTLTGNGGSDIFVFGGAGLSATGSTPTSIRRDIITDFISGVDKIQLNSISFTALATPTIPVFATYNGPISNLDKVNALIVYNQPTGELFYNPNGTAFGTAGTFAILTGAPTVVAADFTVT